jgi:hypothetical protein
MNKSEIKNFVVTGCSFTASILEDVQPTAQSWNLRASHWPHTVFAVLGPEDKNFVNLAMGAGGNTAAFVNLLYFLNRYDKIYLPENTLIAFNITALTRKDRICKINDIRQSIHRESVDTQKYLDLSWYPEPFDSNECLDHVIIQNACKVIESITYLENRKFSYFFMLMNDEIYTHSPIWFKTFLDARKNKSWILLDDYLSMESFSNSIRGWSIINDSHPNLETNRVIGKKVADFIGLNDKQ